MSLGTKEKSASSAGRPRSFNVDKALDRALVVFRHKGYMGASLADLTKAMGINRPSLYAAFGDKEALFRRALDRYLSESRAFMEEALKEPSARAFVERVLRGICKSLTDPSAPGCLTVHGALVCDAESEPIRRELAHRRKEVERIIQDRLKRARKDGDLPSRVDPADFARYLATVIHGIAVQAAGGATRSQLERVAEIALRAWPE
jgi:AcrR family transcriptional regulator